ncbi:MAG: TonB-dependent receptor [Longimicrobiales bacterium]|nr:TonB-dependent receptor [Longimicrobiales bacterium]
MRVRPMLPFSHRAAALLAFLLASISTPASAQAPGTAVHGRVLDGTGVPVADVTVRVEGAPVVTISDTQGRYRLAAVPAGEQVVRAERLGFATARVPVTVPASGEVQLDIRLALRALELEGITVTADASGRARGEVATATVIESAAIRHQTATSLAGVLELLPGVELKPPTLGEVQQLTLRAVPTSGIAGSTSAAELAAFGTLIVLDGIPLSNNANLQSLGSGADLGFATSAGGGVDLRQIPASTLERVEVIRGVPSARYGDLTQGAVIVDTRAGAFAPETRVQYDAMTTEGTTVGGWELDARRTLTANLDYARTRSSPGVTDDVANRVAGQLRFATRLDAGAAGQGVGSPRLDGRVDFYRLEDDRPENPNTRPGSASQARDSGVRLSGLARWGEDPQNRRVTLTAAVTRLWQHSFATADLVRGAMPFTDRLTEGTSRGRFVSGGYTSELTVDGAPWLVYGRAEAEEERRWLGLRHDVRAGLEFRREWNNGAGYQFDMARVPQVTFNGVQGYDRPRGFASIPGLATTGLYLDDRVRGLLGEDVPWTLQFGLRADALHENGSWLPRPREVAIQPRISGEMLVRPWLRLKGGWGRMAKAPSLGSMYPAPQYNDVVNVNWYANAAGERLAVLTTYIFDTENPDLGFSTARKAEAGFEVGGGGSVLSVVAFQDRIEGGVGLRQEVTSVRRDHYQLTDSVTGNGIPPEIIEPPWSADTVPILVQRPVNHLSVTSEGIEMMATLPEIPRVRTRVQVQGSFVRSEWRSDALHVGTASRFSDFQLSAVQRRAPYWAGIRETGEKRLMTYRLIHHQPALGLVVTATIQHNLKDLRDDPGSRDMVSWAGYLTRNGTLVPVPESERGRAEYQDLRLPRGGLIAPQSAPRDWMMGLQVSKALPLDGELRFWAFNALDRVGRYGEAEGQARLYGRVQFGAELNLKPGVVWGELR